MTSDDLIRDINSDDFFRGWKPLPEQDKECLPDGQLLAWSKKPETDWPVHLRSCEQCSEVMGLLVDPKSPRRLHEFLSKARENALKVAPERPPSVLTYLKAFLSGMQPRWVVLTSAALVLMVGFFFWSYKREVASGEDQIVSVSFDKDNYPQTVELLQKYLGELRAAHLTSEQRRIRTNELNGKLNELKQQSLDDEQIAKVASLVAQYRSALVLQASGQTSGQTSGDDTKPPEISLNNQSKLATKAYVAIDQVISNKGQVISDQSSDSNDTSLLDVKTANAVSSASEAFDIKSISPEKKQIIVEDRRPNSSEEQRIKIEERFALTNKENFTMKIVPPGYKSGISTVSFSPPNH